MEEVKLPEGLNTSHQLKEPQNHSQKKSKHKLPHIEICEALIQGNDRLDETEIPLANFHALDILFDAVMNGPDIWKVKVAQNNHIACAEVFYREKFVIEQLQNFFIKFEIFSQQMLQASMYGFITTKVNSNQRYQYITHKHLTLLGRQYFELSALFLDYQYFLQDFFSPMCETWKLLQKIFLSCEFKGLLGTSVQLEGVKVVNTHAKKIKSDLKVYQNTFKQNYENLDYLGKGICNRLFAKDRLIMRFMFSHFNLIESPEALCDTFSDLIKRIKGKDRISPDIEYIRILDGYKRKPTLDVLFFIEPMKSHEDVDQLIIKIQNHWVKAVHYKTISPAYKNAPIEEVRGLTLNAMSCRLMSSSDVFQSAYLLVEEIDRDKKNAVEKILLPFFVGQAVFLQRKRHDIKHTRQVSASRIFSSGVKQKTKLK